MSTNNEFDYYVIESDITERTPLLMNDGNVDTDGINFLYYDTTVSDDYVAPLQFLMPLKNPNMDVDYLFLETYAVFSKKVCDVLQKNMPIKNLQLVKACIRENGELYNDFRIANVYGKFQLFDKNLCKYDEINHRGRWMGLEKIELDKEKMAQIPMEERLVFKATEDSAFKLYHKSIIEIIKSTNPKGMRFISIEEWHAFVNLAYTH